MTIETLHIISYFTRQYAGEIARLIKSLRSILIGDHRLRFHCQQFPDPGDWHEGTSFKPLFLFDARRSLQGPILFVDADAYFHGDPLDAIDVDDRLKRCDIAMRQRGRTWLTGTMLINDTEGARAILSTWIDYNRNQHIATGTFAGCGQSNLNALTGLHGWPFASLPDGLCWVLDEPMPLDHPSFVMIIEHLQASRDVNPHRSDESKDRRRARVQQLDAIR